MAQPVWILSVDLQTKTATFQSGMADAARSARSAFKEINEGAMEMGGSVSKGSLDVRHALGLVDNTIRGAHSMAMVDLIRMFKDSALVMGALPFAMTAAGFALVAELVVKGVQAFNEYRQAVERLKDDQTKMHTAILDVFNGLDEKILEAQKQTDELTNNHLGALHNELMLIDHTSLSDLKQAFDAIQKSADQTFGDLKASWYEMGIGSDGAKHALDEFATSYKSLLAQGKDKDASGLLSGTLETAQKVLALQNAAKADAEKHGNSTYLQGGAEAYKKYVQDINALKAYGVGISDKEVQSQQALIGYLNAQVEVEQKVATLKRDDVHNAQLTAAKESSRDDNGVASKVAAGRALMMRDMSEQYKAQVQLVQDGERLVIDATKQGSAERLQAIEDAMHREEADGLQDTEFYKQLAIEKLAVQREMGQQAAEQAAALAREASDNALKFDELDIAAEKEKQALINSGKRVSLQAQLEQAIHFADEEYNAKRHALDREMAALNQNDQNYLVSKQKLQDQEKQLWQQHENELAAIREKAEIETNEKLSNSYQQFANSVAGSMAHIITGQQSLAKTFENLAAEMISDMLKNSILYAMSNTFRQQSDARAAGSAGFKWGMEHGGPAAPVLAPVMAAAAFAGAMAFESGTDRVPGVGRGDIVPAMLSPGEGVVPGGVMDGLRNMARNGGFDNGGTHYHVAVSPRYTVNAVDAAGFSAVLEKHSGELEKHFNRAVRRLNR